MILNLFGPHAPQPPVDLLSASARDAIITHHLQKHLPGMGLREMSARRWVDGSAPPVRRLFQLELLKGAGLTAWWGFSLDFVPHVSGGKLRWHRSDRTAMLDVIVNPKNLPQPC